MSARYESHVPAVLFSFRQAVSRGLQAVAVEIAGEAKKRTPVDTGRLRASIAWAAEGERHHKDTATGRDGTPVTVQFAAAAPEGVARVGTNVKYAPFVHEDLDAQHTVGQAKFIEEAFTDNEARAKALMRMALKGRL